MFLLLVDADLFGDAFLWYEPQSASTTLIRFLPEGFGMAFQIDYYIM